MAYTAHKDEDSLVEHFDPPEVLQLHAKNLAALIESSTYFTVFTGAGVSTLCGIPDFRGPTGVWTLAAKGEKRTGSSVNAAQAIPSFTHMALVELEKRNKLKFIISQNCDGLHRKSGIPSTKIAEIHGNRNLEKCAKCGKDFLRDFDATASYIFDVHDHRTGRKCNSCGGDLLDTIINFGDNLREEDLKNSWSHTQKSDLCLVIGSSCTVRPACQMPEHVGRSKHGKLVICNLQKTPLDSVAEMCIHARSDDLMRLVMQHLGINVPSFTLQRRVCVHVNRQSNTSRVWVYAVDPDGTIASIFPGIVVNGDRLEADPFIKEIPANSKVADIELFFYGHYNEPPVSLKVDTTNSLRHYFDMTYDPMTGKWTVQSKGQTVSFLNASYVPPQFPSTNTVATATSQLVGFSVNPREDCPHFQAGVAIGVSSTIRQKFTQNVCDNCNDSSENWICLSCGKTFCSRYVNGHCRDHNEATGHAIALSFSDLSVWCYKCSEYIKDPFLTSMFVGELYKAKFGENPHSH